MKMEAQRVTQQMQANEQLLYFTTSSLDQQDESLVFVSDRTGHPNIFARDLASGDERGLAN